MELRTVSLVFATATAFHTVAPLKQQRPATKQGIQHTCFHFPHCSTECLQSDLSRLPLKACPMAPFILPAILALVKVSTLCIPLGSLGCDCDPDRCWPQGRARHRFCSRSMGGGGIDTKDWLLSVQHHHYFQPMLLLLLLEVMDQNYAFYLGHNRRDVIIRRKITYTWSSGTFAPHMTSVHMQEVKRTTYL